MYYYIYKTTNVINGKIYVGKRTSVKLPEDDTDYLGSGTILNAAINKHGTSAFIKDIIEICSKDKLDEREKFWIKEFKAKELGYNLTDGGTGGNTLGGRKLSQYHKERISAGRKGLKFSESHKQALSQSHTGKKTGRDNISKNPEAKKKISESLKRYYKDNPPKPLSENSKKNISDRNKGNKHFLGRKHSVEARVKISEKNKGKAHSEESKAILSFKTKNQPKLICPHCGVSMKIPNVYQYHFSRCKSINNGMQ